MKKLYIIVMLLLTGFLFSCEEATNNNKIKLDAPIISLNEKTISWNNIENATKYKIFINNVLKDTIINSSYFININEPGTYDVCVKAIGGYEYTDSDISNIITLVVEEKTSSSVNIFMINDSHGSFIDLPKRPGVQKVSGFLNYLSEEVGDHIKIANGDILQGSYVSNINRGKPLIDALNHMDFDCFVIGNHEFDWGLDEIKRFTDGNIENGEANFPFLGANIFDKETNKRVDWLDDYIVIEQDGIKVGIIGVIGSTLESSINATYVSDYDFVDYVPIVKQLAKELRNEQGCDLVILSTHEYEEESNERIARLTNDERIDAILCGHTHQQEYDQLRRPDGVVIPVVENYANNTMVSSLSFEFSSDSLVYSLKQYSLWDYDYFDEMSEIMDLYSKDYLEGATVLGFTPNALSREDLGLIAVNSMTDEYSVDYSIINTGGVRSTINVGDIEYSEVYETFPFDNNVIIMTILGSDLLSFMNANGYMMYIDDSYSPSKIQKNSYYEVAIIDYVFNSTYNTKYFKNSTYYDTNVIVRDVIKDYIDEHY